MASVAHDFSGSTRSWERYPWSHRRALTRWVQHLCEQGQVPRVGSVGSGNSEHGQDRAKEKEREVGGTT